MQNFGGIYKSALLRKDASDKTSAFLPQPETYASDLRRRALFRFRKFRFFARSHDRGAVFVQQRRQSPCISRKTEEIIYARMRIHNDLNAFHAALRIGLYESFLFHFFLQSQHYFKERRAFAALAVVFIITRMCVFCNCRCGRAKRAPLIRLPIAASHRYA